METEWVRYDGAELTFLRQVPHVSNAKEETRAAYAKEQGYLPLQRTERPGRLYRCNYKKSRSKLTQTWQPMEAEEARTEAQACLQEELAAALAQSEPPTAAACSAESWSAAVEEQRRQLYQEAYKRRMALESAATTEEMEEILAKA